jgi:hypothetical protein
MKSNKSSEKNVNEKKFIQTVKEFHIGFVIGHLFNFIVWTLLQQYTQNSVIVFPWFYYSLGISYFGLWFQLIVIYVLGYRNKTRR